MDSLDTFELALQIEASLEKSGYTIPDKKN